MFKSRDQKSTFSPIWMIRWLFSTTWVICPNCAEDRLLFGRRKFTLLKTLKASARNCRPIRSFTLVTFSSPKSVLKYLGPRRMFDPVLPNDPVGLCANLDVSNHC